MFKKFDLSQKGPPNPVPKRSWIVKLFNYSECWLFEWREKTAWLVAKYEKARCPKSKAQKTLSRMGQMQRYISGLWSRYIYVTKSGTYTAIPLHLLQLWEAQYLSGDSDYFWDSVRREREKILWKDKPNTDIYVIWVQSHFHTVNLYTEQNLNG